MRNGGGSVLWKSFRTVPGSHGPKTRRASPCNERKVQKQQGLFVGVQKFTHLSRFLFFSIFFFDPPKSFSSTKRWKGGKITLPLHFFEDGVWEGGGRGGGGLQRKILISPSSFLSSVRRKRGGGGEEGGCLNPSLRRRLHLQSSSSSLPCFTAPLFSAPNLNTCTPLYPTRRKEGKSFC